jgi:hypothetical protein
VCRPGKNIFTFFLLYCFLFTQYLYADQTRCHVSMVVSTDIAPRPSLLSSTIDSMTWCLHHAMTNVASAALSRAWLDIYIASMVQQHRYQDDLGAWRLLPRQAVRLGGSPQIRLVGLRSTTPTDSLTWVQFYLHHQPQLKASVSSPQWHGTLRQTS